MEIINNLTTYFTKGELTHATLNIIKYISEI